MLAIVLSRRDWREFDQIITFYSSEQGKVDLIARGIKKSISKNSPTLEVGNIVAVETVGGRDSQYVTSTEPYRMLARARLDLGHNILVVSGLYLVEKLVAGTVADERVFDLLTSWLEFVDVIERPARLLLSGLLLQLLKELGFAPVFEACVLCGAPSKIFRNFSIESGGVVCAQCASKTKSTLIDQTMFNSLQLLSNGSWDKIQALFLEKTTMLKIERIVLQFALFHSGHDLRFLNSVDKFLDGQSVKV